MTTVLSGRFIWHFSGENKSFCAQTHTQYKNNYHFVQKNLIVHIILESFFFFFYIHLNLKG